VPVRARAYLDLHRGCLEGPVDHGQHAALDALRRRLGQQQVHLLQEDQQNLHSQGAGGERGGARVEGAEH